MFNSNKKIKQLIKQLSKPRERVSCPLPGHTHLALLLLPLVHAHSFTSTPWSHPSGLVAPTCSCLLIHTHSFTPTHSLLHPGHTHLALLLPLVHAYSFTPTHSLLYPGHTRLALLLPLVYAHSFTLTWSSAGFCSAPLLGHTLCWFLLIPATWSDLSGLHSCPFQPVCLYQIHS